jgi:hypothetical protein
VDLSRRAQPDHSLAGLVAGLLESATSPESWALIRPEVGDLGGRDGIADPAA